MAIQLFFYVVIVTTIDLITQSYWMSCFNWDNPIGKFIDLRYGITPCLNRPKVTHFILIMGKVRLKPSLGYIEYIILAAPIRLHFLVSESLSISV